MMKIPVRIISVQTPRISLILAVLGLGFCASVALILSSGGDTYAGYMSHSVRVLAGMNNRYEADYTELRDNYYSQIPYPQSVVNTSGVVDPEMTSWLMTQAYRRHLVELSCDDEAVSEDTRTGDLLYELSHFQTDSLYVDTKHKVLYCAIPKVACSSWKGVLASLTGAPEVNGSRPRDIGDVHDSSFMRKIGLTQLRDYSFKEVTDIVKNYKKFLMVRHPLERLVSAYRDKFVKDNRWTKGFHKKFGKRIVRLYRRDPATEALQKGNDVTFPEFIAYLIDESVPEKYKWNPHWASYQELCLPCHMKYDFILKYDTFDSDSDLMMRRVYHVNNSGELFPRRNAQKVNSKHKINELTATLSKYMLKKIIKLYRKDFRMFGYTPNEDDYAA